jgi:hypothetical protein
VKVELSVENVIETLMLDDIQPLDPSVKVIRRDDGPRLPRDARDVLDALIGLGEGEHSIEEKWRTAAYAALRKRKDRSPDAVRQAFHTNRKALVAAGRTVESGDTVRIVSAVSERENNSNSHAFDVGRGREEKREKNRPFRGGSHVSHATPSDKKEYSDGADLDGGAA